MVLNYTFILSTWYQDQCSYHYSSNRSLQRFSKNIQVLQYLNDKYQQCWRVLFNRIKMNLPKWPILWLQVVCQITVQRGLGAANQKPNIIFIAVDDMGKWRIYNPSAYSIKHAIIVQTIMAGITVHKQLLLSFKGNNDIGYNNPEVETPNLNVLANNGVILDSNYVYPVCSPYVNK